MKKFTKLLAIIMAFAMIFAFAAGCGPQTEGSTPSYTFRDYMVTSPTTWSPHTWETNSDSVIYSFITDSLLTFSMTEDKKRYEVTPSMAESLPVDVTHEYKGTLGVPSSAKQDDGYAWRFKLDTTAKWENGVKIDADTYIYSMQQMLNSQMLNRRSDSYTGGPGAIYGARNYLYSQRTGYYPVLTSDASYSNESKEVGAEIYFSWNIEAPKPIQELYALFGLNVITWADIGAIDEGVEFQLVDKDENPTVNVFTKWEEKISQMGEPGKGIKIFDVTGLDSDDYPVLDAVNEQLLEELEQDLQAVMTMWLVDWKYATYINQYLPNAAEWLFYFEVAVGTSEDYGDTLAGWTHEYFTGIPYVFDKYEWKDVGFKKINDYTIDVVFVNPITEMFYVAYQFGSGTFLVYEPLYESCKVEPLKEGGLVTSTYCTSKATTISYGPYKLENYQIDKEIYLKKNTNWFGYSSELYTNQYETTDIVIEIGITQETALMNFLDGKLSTIDLVPADMATYGTSPHLQVVPETYTYKITVNGDRTSLLAAQNSAGSNVNKVMLSYRDFRQALSYAMDRSEYSRQLSPSSQPGYGLVNYMYVSDYQTGALYRDEVLAKLSSVAVYYPDIAAAYEDRTSPYNPNNFLDNYDTIVPDTGDNYTYGEHLEYLYESMTGRSIETAKALFVKAFGEAIDAGDFNMSQTVTIDYVSGGVTPSPNFHAHAQLVQKYIDEALKGTDYEGKVVINVKGSTSEEDYWDKLRAGQTDVAVNAWGGDPFGPFTIINDCYLNDGQRHEYMLNEAYTKSIMITLNIEGEDKTYSLWQWGTSLAGDSTQNNVTINYSNADYATKVLISTTLEYYWLTQYCSIPVNYNASTNLVSKQVTYATDTYIQLLAFGGIRYLTYNYTDAQWANFISDSANLNYAG